MTTRETRKPGAAGDGHDPGGAWRLYRAVCSAVDRRWGWDRLPRPVGLAVLVGLRDSLRRYNLHDTTHLASVSTPPVPPYDPGVLATRTYDGTYNDLAQPGMGRAGSRFGRNVALEAARQPTRDEVLDPSPREVSRALMTRHRFIEATTVNALVAPWLQWMIRDWFSHGQSPTDNPWRIELTADDAWAHRPLTIMRSLDDATRAPGMPPSPPTFLNTSTHWWDASQIYGTTAHYQESVRTGRDGKLHVKPDGSLPMPMGDGNPTTEPGFWLGLVLLQTLFTREHNAVCDMLRTSYPGWGDEEIFQRARLIVAALIAKIHTVEWTPAVISHPTMVTGMRANWWGLAGERLSRVFGRISSNQVLSGIPGAATQHYGVPYSLTEEFTAVYRMHPLTPDHFSLRALADDGALRDQDTTLREISGAGALDVLSSVSMVDLLYTFGTQHPGLVTLHNFPRFLQEFVRPDGAVTDLAATDILRTRELGVPRYCEFRRQLGLDAPVSFDDLGADPDTTAEMARIYRGDIEKLDLMVGMFAERLPQGFAFSDTAFRIFIVMASRRLNSDRFLTTDFTPAVYTPAGMRWIADNTMATVLLRHHPELRPAMRSATNAFTPWQRSGTGSG